MKIVVAGAKASGKSTVSKLLAERLGLRCVEADEKISELFREWTGFECSCAEICRKVGEAEFRRLEAEAVEKLGEEDWCVVSLGGGSLMNPKSRRVLRGGALWLYLDGSADVLWGRVMGGGKIPAYLDGCEDPAKCFAERVEKIRDVLLCRADCVVEVDERTPEEVADAAVVEIEAELGSRSGAANTFGEVIKLTTFGESHGPMIGAVLDGVRPGVEISEEDIQKELDRRRPGRTKMATQRKEDDRVQIVSGVFEGRTTGCAIGMLIKNKDQKSGHYDDLKDVFRPGHADFTFWRKYGLRDHRGGGRSSGRETACRVAGGAVAKKLLAERGVTIRTCTLAVGKVKAERFSWEDAEANLLRCPDAKAAEQMEKEILDARSAGDSVGGVVQVQVDGLPAGLGDPVFAKLDARIAQAMFSLGSVKGLEFGSGFGSAAMLGSENNDAMSGMSFESNNAGGIFGGISNGEPVVARMAVKPTPSVSLEQRTCDTAGRDRTIEIKGRHDPCIVPRVLVVMESMMALVLLDAWEIQERIRPGWSE
ncbi:Chorismate synthase [Anaerohalosphaera lusitana]|uniref:Multifunctional fusion protein n=1 Tax=Anaerohalosphaera lusitana TaxID=1936003 RepID=A0A1U9NQ86_9BACT|nr:chorismate synthase [Anaerohalosphaera lusitana]AQT69676.1 Chorismate synthase [Anaerohalosphaera lusitana]